MIIKQFNIGVTFMKNKPTEKQIHNDMIKTLIQFTAGQLNRKNIKLIQMKEDLEAYRGFSLTIKDPKSVVHSRVSVLEYDIRMAEALIKKCNKGLEYLESQKIK